MVLYKSRQLENISLKKEQIARISVIYPSENEKAMTTTYGQFVQNGIRQFKKHIFSSSLLLKGVFAVAQDGPLPGQPATGPGGAEYLHRSTAFYDSAKTADGYWLFEPADPAPDSAEVVVFLHGYGAYNPMCYGKWIKHLVAKGNIVIYPRYQWNLVFPRPKGFPSTAAQGIKDALEALQNTPGHVRPKLEKVTYIGHSYGGVTAAHLAVHWEKFGVPKPAAMLLAQPGTGPFKGAILEDYRDLDPDLKLTVIVGEDDYVVGDVFARHIFETAINTPHRNLIYHRRDTTVRPWVLASHNEPYAYDLDFDTGVRNYTAKKVLRIAKLDEVDFHCYWKFADALMDYTRHGIHGEYVFGNTPTQRFMGMRSDGRPVRFMDVFTPNDLRVSPVFSRR